MQEKQKKDNQQEQTLRFKILPLLNINTPQNLPLEAIDTILTLLLYLQVLKFPIDHYTKYWIGYPQPILLWVDLTYYISFLQSSSFQIILVASLVLMNLYWIINLSLFLTKHKLSLMALNIRKLVFIIYKNVLFLPLFNIVLSTNNCQNLQPFRPCFSDYNLTIKIIAYSSFVIFAFFLMAQSFISFEFLPDPKYFKNLKKSNFTTPILLTFLLLNECIHYYFTDIIALIVLDLSSILLLIIIVIKEESQIERVKLTEYSFLSLNKLALVMVNIIYFTSQELSLLLYFILAIFLLAATQQLKTYSLKFELQNINKWPTADIIIRYTNTMRYYLSRKDQYIFKVYLQGYAEMHRQKCDSPVCPYRAPLTQYELKMIESGQIKKDQEDILRTQKLIKKIYMDGYKLTPINPQLQYEYASFLYLQGQKEVALKNLLLINYQELPLHNYFKYSQLKALIHFQMVNSTNMHFLDLVSELHIKRMENEILQKFQKAALINLQFWSILNEDHPDFQKLNEVGYNRIKMRTEVKQTYRQICSIAHNQKITSLYVHYLESIENDEAMYNSIYQQVQEQYKLRDKIVLQDWANTSNPIILVSIEETNYANIIDVNNAAASLFGYERYQLLNRPFKILFSEDLRDSIKSFLDNTSQNNIQYMTHKSGYLLKLKAKNQNYNSMETGMAAICTFSPDLAPNSCFFIANKHEKIISVSPSIIPLTGLELKNFQGQVHLKSIFHHSLAQLLKLSDERQTFFELGQIIRSDFDEQIRQKMNKVFKVKCEITNHYILINLQEQRNREKKVKNKEGTYLPSNFEFQVQATLSTFKYFGNFDSHEIYLSQFSQLNYAQSLKQAGTIKDYSKGIDILRLKDNIIQVIEDNEEELNEHYQRRDSQSISEIENLARKDEQQIFESKPTFQKFIEDYSFAKSVNFILLIGVLITLSLYALYFFLSRNHNNAILPFSSEVTYQNLIIGAITKEASLLSTLKLYQKGLKTQPVNSFKEIYNDNIQYLQNIQLLGSSPYQIKLSFGGIQQNFLTDQFILNFINYAQQVYKDISSASTFQDIVSSYGKSNPYNLNYLTTNAIGSKQIMFDRVGSRASQIVDNLKSYINNEIFMLIGGIFFSLVFAFLLLVSIHRINKERITIFEIFLDITEIQIQQFSSKTQKFLISLHVEDTNGEIDIDEEVQNTKKINSSTFAKKKRFKLINFNKSIYFKLLIIPIFSTAFFIHSYLVSHNNLLFASNSFNYLSLTSQADYQFYSGLNNLQNAIINNTSIPSDLSTQYILYYRDYFDTHFSTYGLINNFHQTFTSIFMLDICNGTDTPYGSTKIPQSCGLPLLYPNGSYLVFTDLSMKTQYFTNITSLTTDHYLDYEVISKTHRKLSQTMINVQQDLINDTQNNLLTTLLIWTFLIIGIAFLYGIPIMKHFVDEINEVKNILSILPISIAKELPLATKYFTKILKSN